jgi:hypothetical protein
LNTYGPPSSGSSKGLGSLARTPSPYTAGDLLGKSHEELVLLLLSLRREGANLMRGIKQTRADMDAQMGLMNGPRSEMAVRLYEDLSCRLRDLERRVRNNKHSFYPPFSSLCIFYILSNISKGIVLS